MCPPYFVVVAFLNQNVVKPLGLVPFGELDHSWRSNSQTCMLHAGQKLNDKWQWGLISSPVCLWLPVMSGIWGGLGWLIPKSNLNFNFTLPLVCLVVLLYSLDLFFFVSFPSIHQSGWLKVIPRSQRARCLLTPSLCRHAERNIRRKTQRFLLILQNFPRSALRGGRYFCLYPSSYS